MRESVRDLHDSGRFVSSISELCIDHVLSSPFLLHADFFQSLDASALEDVRRKLSKTFSSFSKEEIVVHTNTAEFSFLDAVTKTIVHNPFGLTTARQIPKVWLPLENVKRIQAMSVVCDRIRAAHTMVIHWILWAWLNRVVRRGVASLNSKGTTKSKEWNCRLAQSLYTFVQGRSSTISVSTSTFISNAEERVHVITRRQNPRFHTHEEILPHCRAYLRQVISGWMGFPSEGDTHLAQSDLIGSMLLECGGNIVYLSSAIYAYQHVWSTLLLGRRDPISDDAMNTFRLALATHPISDLDSEERRILDEIGSMFEPSNSHLAITTVTGNYRVQAGLRGFVEFLRYLIPLIGLDGEDPESVGDVDREDIRLRLLVADDMDLYLPFREHLPSVAAVRDDEGPFSLDNWQSRQGFFSALVFRCITFGACAARDGNVMFESLEDFKEFCGEHQDDPEYLCNTAPYRTPNPKRSPDCADRLWTISSKWEELLVPDDDKIVDAEDVYDGHYTLKEFYDILQGLHVPNLGQLGCYLLAADYAYTPLVQMPDMDAMGRMVYCLNKGALAGLQDLGLLPGGRQHQFTEEDVACAFTKAFSFVSDSMDPAELDAMIFDPVMMENALCKYKRLRIAQRGLVLPDVSTLTLMRTSLDLTRIVDSEMYCIILGGTMCYIYVLSITRTINDPLVRQRLERP